MTSTLREQEQIGWLAHWMDKRSHPGRKRTRAEITAIMLKSGKTQERIDIAFQRLEERGSPYLEAIDRT